MRNKVVVRWIGVLTAIVLVGAGGWWAGRVTLGVTDDEASASPYQVNAVVTEASVGQVVNYTVSVRQQLKMVATNLLSGIVTSISPGFLDQGAEVYSVANVPVRVARGSMPFYRDLAEGCEGSDVEQVQQLLADLGYDQPVTGDWAGITTANVKAWQRDQEQEQTGRIPLGTLAAVPQLPATITPGEAIAVGAQASPGVAGLMAYLGTPEFALQLTVEQANNLPSDATVQIDFEEYTWSAKIIDSRQQASGQTDLILAAPDGSVVCGVQCDSLPAAEFTSMSGRVQVVPPISGPAVPAAAVRTDEAGGFYVLRPDGTRTTVTVLASDRGLAVISGLAVGERIVVLQAESGK